MRRLRALFFESWEVPLAIVTVIASLALFAAPYFYVRIQTERKASIQRLCNAVVPTRTIYQLVLSFPENPRSNVSQAQTQVFRAELVRGIAAVDRLRCQQNPTR